MTSILFVIYISEKFYFNSNIWLQMFSIFYYFNPGIFVVLYVCYAFLYCPAFKCGHKKGGDGLNKVRPTALASI